MPSPSPSYGLRTVRDRDAPAVLSGYLSAPDMSRQGTMTTLDEAREQVADGGWGLEHLELGHRVNNPASEAVARAAGFVHEGTERGKFLVGGERIDVLTYGRLRTDPAPTGPQLAWRPLPGHLASARRHPA